MKDRVIILLYFETIAGAIMYIFIIFTNSSEIVTSCELFHQNSIAKTQSS